MILFFGMLQCYEVSEKLLDVPIRITPVGNKGAYLALGGDGLQLSSSPDDIARIKKKGNKKYLLLMKGTPVCHKEDKRADSCEKGMNKTNNWNIKKGPKGYSIKSAEEKYMGFRQYCLTYDKGPSEKVEIKKCRRDRRNQLFDMEPVEPEKETPKQDEDKNEEPDNCEDKNGEPDNDRKEQDDESLTYDSLSSSEEVEITDPKVGPGNETPQQPEQPEQPVYPPNYPAVPQGPMYAYVPYAPPQPEQPCVCPPDGVGAQQPQQPPVYPPNYPAVPQEPMYAYVPYAPPQPEQSQQPQQQPQEPMYAYVPYAPPQPEQPEQPCVCPPDGVGAQQAA